MAYNLLNDLCPNITEPEDQFVLSQGSEAGNPGKVGEPTKIRILAEAVVPATEVPAVQAEGRLLGEQLGGIAAKGTVRVDVTAEDALTPKEARRQKYLSMDLGTLFDAVGLNDEKDVVTRTRTINALKKYESITTLRDVLLHGEATVNEVRNVARKSIDLLKLAITESGINVSWQNEPTMKDFVDFCPSLDYLPAKYYCYEHRSVLEGYSVESILAMDEQELSRFLTNGSGQDLETAQNLLNHLREVAVEFAQAAAEKA